MAITVIVRSGDDQETRLTFDGTQRVVIGRGPGSDIRLPDRSVSHRHASLRAVGADFAVVDEGSTNGTFVGAERVAPHTSRLVKSGDAVRVGRIWLLLAIDQSPVTRDVAGATRDLALALVAKAMAIEGVDRRPRVRVVGGADAGAILVLGEEGREYVVGRAAHCDLPLADPDASREHTIAVRRDGHVFLRDLGAKNGTWLAGERLGAGREVAWRVSQTVQLGRTVLVLEEPVGSALAEFEGAPDEVVDEAPPAPPPVVPPAPPPQAKPLSAVSSPRAPSAARRARWTLLDIAVMGAALGVLALSLLGLVWLLRH